MAKIRKIYDQTIKPDGSKTTIYPITSTRAVYTPEGATLDSYLKDGYFHGADLRGYKTVSNVTDLPTTENQFGWLIGEDLYVWVGTGGDTPGGLYHNCGHFRTPYVPDDEDLVAASDNELKLKDRTVEEGGMGYVILRKNKSFEEQVTEENTIYEIRYDFDLENSEVTVPSGCVLKFNGGKISNGTLKGTYDIDAPHVQIFDNVGVDQSEFYASWFGVLPSNRVDNSERMQHAINNAKHFVHNNFYKVTFIFDIAGVYFFNSPITLTSWVELCGIKGKTEYNQTIRYTPEGNSTFITITQAAACIHNLDFEGTLEVVGERPDNDYVGTTFINFDIDSNNTDSYIYDCGFATCRTGIRIIGRQWRIEGCEFYGFGNGIEICDQGTPHELDGPSARNIVRRCKFDASNPMSVLGTSPGQYLDFLTWNASLVNTYSCINNKSVESNTLLIDGCYSAAFNSLYRGRLHTSVITNNTCINCYREIMWLTDVINSVISNNKFLCQYGTYVESITYKGQSAGIVILGHFIRSTIAQNVIQETRYPAIYMPYAEDGNKFVGNSITGNTFDYCSQQARSGDVNIKYVVYITERLCKSNVISGNNWFANKDQIIYPDYSDLGDVRIAKMVADGDYDPTEVNVIENNYSDIIT